MMESKQESTFEVMNQDFVKLNRFDGSNFNFQKDKMMFLLTTMKISYVLDPKFKAIPEPTDVDTEKNQGKVKEKD